MKDARPIGERFSQVYLARGAPGRDSARMRARVGVFMRPNINSDFANLILQEIGIRAPLSAGGWDWDKFFQETALPDFLDCLTLYWRFERSRGYHKAADKFVAFVERVFREQNTEYTIDPLGGIHLNVDSEFEATRTAAISGLGRPRYLAALTAYERGLMALDGADRDTAAAVRGVFDALETIFRLMFDKAKILGVNEVNHHLRPLLKRVYTVNNDAAAAGAMASSFCDWITAAHHYRHAPGLEDPAPPPLGLAIALVSAGAGYIRWLCELDQLAS